ncbi:ABC transporter permease [Halogranum amylolyticum]|nr:ABC transporter permease [Halogranum amylolyticum]
MPTGVSVTDLQAPTAVAEGEPFTVNITVRNDALSRENHSLTVQYRNQTATQELTLQASGQQTVTQQFPAGSQGNYSLTVDNESRTIQVVSSQTARISNLPERAPPTSAPLVQARTIQGTPLTNATVLIGAQRVQTNASGYVRLPLDSPGEYSPRIEGRPTLTRNSITVEQGARKTFVTDLRVRPRSPSAVTQPTAHLVIYNPWNETLTQKITVRGAGKQTTDSVTLSPEMQATRTMTLPRRTAGTYSVEATTARDTLARTNYTVVSDERLAAAIASSGRTGTTGIGQAVEVAFGNFQLVLPTLVVLAGIMTIGGTTATFAQTVHARRQTVGIYRATGATPGEILKIILGDALRIGFLATALATIIAVSALAVLDTLGLLVVFGVRLSSLPDATVFFAVWGGSLFITLLGTVFATLSLITVPPVTLLSALQPRVPGSDADE